MRRLIISGVAGLLLLAPIKLASAQTSQGRPEATRLTTAGSDWPRSGDPFLFGGSYFYPSGPTVFFDGAVMVRSGSFEGVPIYINATRDPANVVYVRVAGGLMRPYERRRADQVADTLVPPPAIPAVVESEAQLAIRTPQPPTIESASQTSQPASEPVAIETARRPHANRGIWIEFGGRIWLASGAGGLYSPGRFSQIGTYHGFPVYRESTRTDQIYIPSVPGGPVARYSLSDERAPALSE